ncbi:hypothetical protein CAC42_3087 [Sphaceloma murrayae]|uniref:Nucleotide-diphospho-sugar transferase n=1 Tax=Sphaceloma murrayae TaxID=2082308 RepID=A0A2K1QRL5_9PEZI|nr:hypothetical protein CAC42_3087 [Sphaceloma murrayae]
MSSPKPIILCIALFLISALLTLYYQSPTSPPSPFRSSKPPTHHPSHPRLAFATFLGGNTNPSASADDHLPPDSSSSSSQVSDGYFLGARVLAYQLLHSPITATNLSIPFVILTTPDVAPWKIARLRADGATVVPVAKVDNGWIRAADPRWRDVMTKLRLWELEGYDKVCFMDGDTLITRRLDDVFWDEGTVVQTPRPVGGVREGRGEGGAGDEAVEEERGLPRNYMFAAHTDAFGYEHPWPPGEGGYFNVGFFCFRPSREVFEYYMRVAGMQGKFDPTFPEQNLLNHVHRKDGRMPWAKLWEGWNVNWPTERDWRNGVGSFHAKYWDGDPSHDKVLKAIWREQRAEMEGYWRGREAREGRISGTHGA